MGNWFAGKMGWAPSQGEEWDFIYDASSGNLPDDEGWTFTWGGSENPGIEPLNLSFIDDQLVLREIVDGQAIVGLRLERPDLGVDVYPVAAKAIFEVTAGRVQLDWLLANSGIWSALLEGAQSGFGQDPADGDIIEILKPTASYPFSRSEYDIVATDQGVTASGLHTAYLEKVDPSHYRFRYDGTAYDGPIVVGGGNDNSFGFGAFLTGGIDVPEEEDLEVDIRLSYYALRVEYLP